MIYYICNRKRKVEHCHTHCYHGKPHAADQCTTDEVCHIGIKSKKGIIVKCRPATKKELEQYEERDGEIKAVKPWG